MAVRLLLYGATGFTGRRVAEAVVQMGLNCSLAARDESALRNLAGRLQVPWYAVDLADSDALDELVRKHDLVLNASGPFHDTCIPVLEACLRSDSHYIDVSGELPSFARALRYDQAARERGVMLMPGAGFVVAPSDCLALHVSQQLPDATSLRLAFSQIGNFSRGTLRAMVNLAARETTVTRHGHLTTVPVGRLERFFDFGQGPSRSSAVAWADVLTAPRTAGYKNVEVYVEADSIRRVALQSGAWSAEMLQTTLGRQVSAFVSRWWPEGPSATALNGVERVIVAEAETRDHRVWRSTLRLPDGYLVTPPIAVEIASRVLQGQIQPGFQTPAGVYGTDLLNCIPNTRLADG